MIQLRKHVGLDRIIQIVCLARVYVLKPWATVRQRLDRFR